MPSSLQDLPLDDETPRVETPAPWIPPILRKLGAIPLALYCWIFAACLEAMAVFFEQHNGIPIDETHKYSVWAAKYLPAIGVVILSLLWKLVTSELKIITPWASMNEWAGASKSILLDYVTNMEIISVYRAASCRHFALFLALVLSFVCGALSLLANAMTSEAFVLSKESSALVINSTFEFDGTFTHPNGSLIWPPTRERYKPYAAVATSQSLDGQYTPWTKYSHAFESFSGDSATAAAGALVEAQVQSVSTQFECVPLGYSLVHGGSSQNLTAFVSGNDNINCSLPIRQNLTVSFEYSDQRHNSTPDAMRSWLNITSCPESDPSNLFITATVAFVDILDAAYEQDDNPDITPTTVINATGLFCSVDFSTQMTNVTVKGSNGDVVSHGLDKSSNASKIDTNLTMSGVWVYLTAYMDFIGEDGLKMAYNDDDDGDDDNGYEYSEIFGDSTFAVQGANGFSDTFQMDFFFKTLTSGDTDVLLTYMDDFEKFKLDVETLGSSIITQAINFQARRNSSNPVTGSIQVFKRHLVLHRGMLGVLQAVLALIGCAVLLISTVLRPKYSLLDEPGRCAAGAITLANSDSDLRTVYNNEVVSSDEIMHHNLEPLDWKLTSAAGGIKRLQSRKSIETDAHSSNPTRPSRNPGWRPLALRFEVKALISVMLLGTFLLLAALLIYSRNNHGITQNRQSVQYVFQFISTAILVILGYICSGVDAAVTQVKPYRYIRNLPRKKLLPLNDGNRKGVMATYQTKTSQTGLSQVFSVAALLLLPILKVVSSGLYSLTSVPTTHPVQLQVDSSLITHTTSAIAEFFDHHADVDWGLYYYSWLMTKWTQAGPNSRPGILGNLLVSDLTGEVDVKKITNLSDIKIFVRVPAFSIDVSLKSQAVQFYAGDDSEESGCWGIEFTNCRDLEGLNFGRLAECFEDQHRYHGAADLEDGIFSFCFADLLNITGPVSNATPIVHGMELKSGDLNVSFPYASAFQGSINLTQVYVNVTYAYTSKNSWTAVDYDKSTIEPHEIGKEGMSLGISHYTTEPPGGSLNYDSLWPDDPINFFGLLAAYAEFQLHNLTALLDKDELLNATVDTLIAFYAERLTEFRTFARKSAKQDNVEPQKIDGKLEFFEERIVQNGFNTILLEILLAAIFFSYMWIFHRFSSRPILPKSPGSIAAQLSFIADSDLVWRLREDGTTRLTDDDIWDKIALGWWKREAAPPDAERREDEETSNENNPPPPPPPSLRWGIDIGKPFSRQRWNKPPAFPGELENDDHHESQDEEAQDDGRSHLVDLQSQIELQNLPRRRDSETQSDGQQQQQENTQAASEDGSNTTTLGFDLGNTQSLNLLLAEPRFNDAASEDQRSEYSTAGNERSEAQSVNDSISQPLLRPKSR
ncbi:uncharacterized protein BKA78DRAFT_372130 [Phyllosticta capitalensis]|uniref:uncharacterized protein n=1 Tax=Phyllosticta capitalensis TaxID=121624 RepID=UPI0031308BE0